MPVSTSGLLASGLTGPQSDKAGFKNSSSLLHGAKHSTLATSKPGSSHAQLSSSAERLHQQPAAGSLVSTSGSAKWGTWLSTSGAPHAGTFSVDSATVKKSTPAAQPSNSGGFIKSHVTMTRFDSIGSISLTGTGSGSGAAAAGRRSTSVPRSSHTASFDAAHASCSSTSTHMASHVGAKSTGVNQTRSSSTGRSTRSPGAAAKTATGCDRQPTRTASMSDATPVGQMAVPGRARVTLGQHVQNSNAPDSSARPAQTFGVSASSSSIASVRHVYVPSSSVHSGRVHSSSKDTAAVAAVCAGTAGSTTCSSVQAPSSSYLARLRQDRASTAGAGLCTSSSATGAVSMAAVAGRRISSAGPATTSSTSSNRQDALEVLRANRMRVRVPNPWEAPAAAGFSATATVSHHTPAATHASCQGSSSSSGRRSGDVQVTLAAGSTTRHSSSSSSTGGAHAHGSNQAAADKLDSGVAALTALLEKLNSQKRALNISQEQAGSEQQQHQRQGHDLQQQQQHDARSQQHHPTSTVQQQQPAYQQCQQQQSVGDSARSVLGRRTTLPDSGPGERLDIPSAQQQQQQPPVLRSNSGSYLDIIRGRGASKQQQVLQQQQQQQEQQQRPRQQQDLQSVTQLSHQQELYQPSASGSSNGGSTRIYRPIYTPPTSAGGAWDQGSSGYTPPTSAGGARDQRTSLWAPADAAAGVAGVAAGALRRQSGSSWASAGSDAVHPTAYQSSGGGSVQQQDRAGRQQQQQESSSLHSSRTVHDTTHSSNTQQQPGFLISTGLVSEHSYDSGMRQQDGRQKSSSAGDANTSAAGAADQAAAADAAARHAFLRCSTDSEASNDLGPSAAASAARGGTALVNSSSIQQVTNLQPQQQQQPLQQQRQQRDADYLSSMVQDAAVVSNAGTVNTSRPQHQVHRHAVPLGHGYAADDSDSDSDVSEMSCTSGSSSSSSSVDVTVQLRSRAAAVRPQYPSPGGRSSTAAQQALFDTDVSSSSSTRRLAGRVALSPDGAAAPASPGQVPVKAYARSPSSKGVGLPRGCCGIRNQGNTCYQNTAIQLLCCVPELVGALLGQQAVQLLRTAATDAANNRSNSSVQRALLVAAAAAQAGIAWLPKATVGPALQQLVCEMWAFQQLQGKRQRSSPSHRPQTQLQEQQQLQRVTACMGALREAMAELDPRWDDGDQWDCQEFALTLLQAVHSESNRVRGKPQYCELKLQGSEAQQAAQAAAYAKSWDDSAILDIFSWQLQNTMTCCACGKHSHTFDSSQELLVAIPPGSDRVTVQECLARTIFSPEQMVGEEGYKCESCKALREATKQLQLFTYPQVLLLGLKRFETRGGSKGGSGTRPEAYTSRKVSTRVWLDACELLDLTPFCNPAGLEAAAVAGKPPPRYELIAVADHSGGLNGGHYTARGRCVVDGSWAEYNDALVLGADAPSGSSSAAYMMLYRLAG